MNDEGLRCAFGTNYKWSAKPTPKLFVIQYSSFTIHFYGITYAVKFGDAMLITD